MIPFKKVPKAFCLLLCFAAYTSVFGQYRFDSWTTDNGLPQNGVRQITQTPEGYLWFTTFDGLVRFDGVRFTTFNKSNTKGIINNRFTGIYADKDGTLYATTTEDGVMTVMQNGAFSSFASDQIPGHYVARIEPGTDGKLRFLTEDEDRLSKSWYRMTDGKFEFIEKQPGYNENTQINGRSGSRWHITHAGILETKNGSSTFIPLDLSKLTYNINTFEDRDGNLWLGETNVYCIRNGELQKFGEKEGLPGNSLYHSFWQEADGSIWLSSGGSSSEGIGLIQIKDDRVTVWGGKQGLENTSIHSIYNDREGTTWLATNRGLSRRRKQIIQGYSKADGIDHSEIYPILRDRGDNIWLGSTKGLSIYRNGKFEELKLKSPPNKPADETWKSGRMSVQSLWEDPSGKMWVGLNGGIYIVQNGTAEKIYKDAHVYSITNDRSGNVWAATNKGIVRFNDYKVTASYSEKDGLPKEFMTVIFEDSKGTLWFGGYGGLSKFENGQFTNYTTKDGLAGNYLRTIYEDADGTLWIGTYDEGMSRFKDGKFVNFTEETGLYNSGVFAIEEDTAGYFWISSNRGIYRVKRQELNDFADGKIAKISSVGYGKEDGMLSTECNGGRQPASLKDKDGKIWFPTQEGVAIVDPLAEMTNPLPPSIVIEEVLVGREHIDFRGGASVEPGQKDLEIRYTGISLIKSEQIRFQYKLEGHDADWIDAGTRRTAYYSYLPPGSYTFRVKAANSDGVWTEHGGEVKIELKPFFYQTTAFYLISFFAAAMALLLIWKISIHQMKSRERRLKKLVAERTVELAEANENLEKLANSDGLTKIGNRRRFESFLADEWHRALRFKTEISLIMIDIDHFKSFNDAYGHQAGDECLQKVAQAFVQTIKRPTDLVARFGGEEFAIILGGTDASGAMGIAEQAVLNLRKMQIPHGHSGPEEFLTVSVGIATMYARPETTDADLIKAADEALYQAKENGRDQIYVSGHFPHSTVNANVQAHEHFDVNPS